MPPHCTVVHRPLTPWPALLVWLALVLCLVPLGFGGRAQASQLPAPVVLQDHGPAIDAASLAQVWLDPDGSATLASVRALVAQGRDLFKPAVAHQRHQLSPDRALWLHYRLSQTPAAKQTWMIEVALPMVDSVSFYQQDESGQWQRQSAGDTVAVVDWAQKGRYPHFYLNLTEGQPRDFFLRVEHATPIQVPVQLLTERQYREKDQTTTLVLGMVFGAFVLLIAACLGQCWVYRDVNYARYAVYGLLAALAVGAFSGVASHVLWPDRAWWSEASRATLALIALAAACNVVREISAIASSVRWLDRLLTGLAVGGVVLAGLLMLLPRQFNLAVLSIYVLLAVLTMLLASVHTARTGDPVGRWLTAAHLPLFAAAVLSALAVFGWIESSWITRFAPVIAMALEVPLSWVALNLRSREHHAAIIRSQESGNPDPLTGLIAASHFHYRERQVVSNYKRNRNSKVAVVYFELNNHQRICNALGQPAGEQALRRCAQLMRNTTRDYDTVSRIGPSRFGVILEGELTRAVVSAIAVRVIAAGQMTPADGARQPKLHFNVACILLNEVLLDAQALQEQLSHILDGMGPHDPLPLRFIKPQPVTASADQVATGVPVQAS